MEIIVIGLIAVLAVVIVACAIMWTEIHQLTVALAELRGELTDHLYKGRHLFYESGASRQPISPIEDDPVEAELPWEAGHGRWTQP